jgi:hypothetical protein
MITPENMQTYAEKAAAQAAKEESEENPLSLFSTSQLKAELKRRKEGNTVNNLTRRELKTPQPRMPVHEDAINLLALDMTLVHGGMHYQCEVCGAEWIMWLEIGVEDHGSHGRSHQPCPFIIGCDCGGHAKHVEWHRDIHLPGPRPIGNGMRYFAYDHSGKDNACGHDTVWSD